MSNNSSTDEVKVFFEWRGNSIKTWGDIANAARSCVTKEDAESFLKAYKEVDEVYVESNLQYIFGYFDSVEMYRLNRLFFSD